MVCVGLEALTDNTITGILAFPSSCDFHFWAKIMAGFFIILTLILFREDEEKITKPDLISAMGVSALATIVISLMGTLVGFISSEVFIEIFVVGIILVVLWMFKR